MCAVLYDAANSFIHQHFVEVSMSEEFLALPFEDVLELVSRDELNVKSEEQVPAWRQQGRLSSSGGFLVAWWRDGIIINIPFLG